jgi:hypothetical protein
MACHSRHQRQGGFGERRAGDPAAVGAARRADADRHQVRLRHGPVRGLHGACRRPADPLVRDAGRGGRAPRSPPSRAWAARIRCSRPGSSTTCRSAATASRARSCRPRLLEQNKAPTDEDIDNAMAATSAAAAPISASARPSRTRPTPARRRASRTPISTRPSPPPPARPAGEPADERALQQADCPKGPTRREVMVVGSAVVGGALLVGCSPADIMSAGSKVEVGAFGPFIKIAPDGW